MPYELLQELRQKFNGAILPRKGRFDKARSRARRSRSLDAINYTPHFLSRPYMQPWRSIFHAHKEAYITKKVLFVEQRPNHKYSVTERGNSKPLAVTNRQAEAIQKAQKIAPDAALHVERVRDIGPGRDKWR